MRPRWRLVIAASLIPVLLFQGFVGYVAIASADRLVHPPRDLDERTPGDVNLSYQNVTLLTEDDIELEGWWIPAERAQRAPVVVFLHGYGASKTQSLGVAEFLHDAGYAIVAFDFRAHGKSGGAYTTLGIDEANDVRAAVAFAVARPEVDAQRVVLFGWSMGAVAALNAASDLPIAAIVVDSPFARLTSVVAHVFTSNTGLPVFPFVPAGFTAASWMVRRDVTRDEPVQNARNIERPILIIQGLADAIVDEGNGRSLNEAAPTSQLWLVPHAEHVGAVEQDRAAYEERVLAFLDASL